MKVVILAGGFGTRLSEFTNLIPKPMVEIGDKPILIHIMEYYSKFGYGDFIIALGFKSHIIKDYFLNLKNTQNDFTINFNDDTIIYHNKINSNWKVTLVNTGSNSMTGGRLKRLKEYLGNETFMLTYGDGLSDINITHLLDFHRTNNKLVTVSAVHPSARFGELSITSNKVYKFSEKPQVENGWINGGYFVIEPEFLNYIQNDETILEREPLELVASQGELIAFLHNGFWQCMDSKRDVDYLRELFESNKAPWI